MKASAILILLALIFSGSRFAASAGMSPVVELPPGVMPLEGRPAPALKLSDMDDGHFDLAAKRGQWVLVHFWASWCGPCRREMPTIQGLMEQVSDSALEIVLINTSETDDDVFSFLSIAAPDLDTLMDYDGEVTARWQPRGLPASFIVDPSGRIQYMALGGRLWDSPEYVEFLLHLVENDKR